MPTIAAIALGSNLGDRRATLVGAIAAIGRIRGTRLLGSSTFHNTAPVGPIAQGEFLNAAAAVETELPAGELLAALHGIEREFGRDRAREQRWGPRTLDLDLLLYGDQVIREPDLEVPHPRMAERMFVLGPLVEVMPAAVIPGVGTVAEAHAALARTMGTA